MHHTPTFPRAGKPSILTGQLSWAMEPMAQVSPADKLQAVSHSGPYGVIRSIQSSKGPAAVHTSLATNAHRQAFLPPWPFRREQLMNAAGLALPAQTARCASFPARSAEDASEVHYGRHPCPAPPRPAPRPTTSSFHLTKAWLNTHPTAEHHSTRCFLDRSVHARNIHARPSAPCQSLQPMATVEHMYNGNSSLGGPHGLACLNSSKQYGGTHVYSTACLSARPCPLV